MAFFNSTNNREDIKKRAVFRFFERIINQFSKLILLNLVYFACILPLFCILIYFICSIFNIAPANVQLMFFVHMSVWLVQSIPVPILGILFTVSLIAYGPLTAGLTHCIRSIVKGEHVFVSDLFVRAKSNLKQGIILGLIDVFVLLAFLLYLSSNVSVLQGASQVLFMAAKVTAIIVSVLYFCLRFYTYTIAVSFDLPIKYIFKNSMLFFVLGFFRNILAFLIVLFVFFTFTSTPRVDIVLLATLFFSICRFSVVFATYPIIEKYMLKTEEKN